MKEDQILIKALYDRIDNTKELNKIIEIGVLRNSFNNISIYESNINLFTTIIITDFDKEKSKKISFTGEQFNMSLQELRELFGKYDIAYNFRDNYTGFFFLNTKGEQICRVYSEKKNNIKMEHDYFSEYSPKSKIAENLTEKDILLNNIVFEVKN